MENSKLIEAFLNFLHNVENDCKAAQDMQAEEDRKTQDILHMIELDELTYTEKGRLMKRLETVRRDRRKYKDSVEELTELVQFVKENKAVIHKMEQLLGKVRTAEKKHKNRMYIPRTNVCDGVRVEKSVVKENEQVKTEQEQTVQEQAEVVQTETVQAETVSIESNALAQTMGILDNVQAANIPFSQEKPIQIPYIQMTNDAIRLIDPTCSAAEQQIITEVDV